MERTGETVSINPITVKRVMVFGLMISCISIIMSVETLYRDKRYIDLIVTTAIFISMLFLIRWLNN
jgi:hypothetical protein